MEFTCFDHESRRVVVLAEKEARQLNHTKIAHEHLLLGILAGNSRAAAHLGGYLLTYEDVRQEVLKHRPQGDKTPTGNIPFVHEVKQVFADALKITETHQHSVVYPEHLAIALFNVSNDIVESILEELEFDKALASGDLIDSADSKEDALAKALGRARPGASLKTLTTLLENDATPRENLAKALKMLTEHMDEEILVDIIAILKQ